MQPDFGTAIGGAQAISDPPPIPVSQARALLGNPLIRSLSPSQLPELLTESELVRFKSGGVISRQSTRVDKVLFVIEGTAKAELLPMHRGELIVRFGFLGPGDDIGLLSVIDGAFHSATVTATESVEVISVHRTRVAQLLRRYPEWYETLAEMAVYRVRASGTWMQTLSSGNIPRASFIETGQR